MKNDNLKFKISIILLLFFGFYFLDSTLAFAAELKFKKTAETVNIGDTFDVSLVLNTEEEYINAVEISLKYSDNLELQNISDGNSIINLWLSKPKLENSQNFIFLSGLIPGGIRTSDGVVLNLTLKSLSSGQGSVQIENAKIFLNDPDTSEAKIKTANLNFEIQNNPSNASQSQKLILDFLPPDEFKIYLSKDRNIFNNSWFISFNAQDKGSGINRYEIREKFLGFWGDWKIGESPYPLSDQLLLSIMEVRAVDNTDMKRTVVLIPNRLYVLAGITGILLLILILLGIRKYLRHTPRLS